VFSGATLLAPYIDDTWFRWLSEIWTAKFFASQNGDAMISTNKNSSTRIHSHSKGISKLATSFFVAGLLLVGAASVASAASYPTWHEHRLAQRGSPNS
jgi:hypothetical protein